MGAESGARRNLGEQEDMPLWPVELRFWKPGPSVTECSWTSITPFANLFWAAFGCKYEQYSLREAMEVAEAIRMIIVDLITSSMTCQKTSLVEATGSLPGRMNSSSLGDDDRGRPAQG